MNDTILERHELSALFGNMSESEKFIVMSAVPWGV